MTVVFSQELLDNSIFKWQELAGKELLIRVGHYPDELGKGMHVCVIGVDKTSGISYVLHTGIEGYKECQLKILSSGLRHKIRKQL